MTAKRYHVEPRGGGDGMIVPGEALAGYPESEWDHAPLECDSVDPDTDEFDPDTRQMRTCPVKAANKAKASVTPEDRLAILEAEVAALKDRLATAEARLSGG